MLPFQSLLPHSLEVEKLTELAPAKLFAPETLEFVEALSNALLRSPSFRMYPELVALGFWMRTSNLSKMKKQFQDSAGHALFQPRGIAFHIAPSNVDSIFIYSWFLLMLCGNKNIVRLSSRTSSQLELLIGALRDLLSQEKWRPIAKRILLVRYAHDAEVSAYFSSLCDVRIIWGGNATVSKIRRLPLPPHACEVAFADKFSLALINAESWTDATDSKRLAWLTQFISDAYWFGQMACSSPRLVVWHGDRKVVALAKESFWAPLTGLLKHHRPELLPVDYVNKRVVTDLVSIRFPAAIIHESRHNDIARVEVGHKDIKQLIGADLHCGGGLFYETSVDTLDYLLPILDRRIQTVAYAGYGSGSGLRDFFANNSARGIDRIVPFGRTLEFSPIWDGFDLFRTFLRQISIC